MNHPVDELANHLPNHFGRVQVNEQLKTSLTDSSGSCADKCIIVRRPLWVDTAVDTADSYR